jgi:hypothetical protein
MSQNKLRAARRAGYKISCANQASAEKASHPVHPVIPFLLLPAGALIFHRETTLRQFPKTKKPTVGF